MTQNIQVQFVKKEGNKHRERKRKTAREHEIMKEREKYFKWRDEERKCTDLS